MAYSETLAERIKTELKKRSISFEEKKMMGGLTFMVDDKMCVGVLDDSLMARIDPEQYDQLLSEKGSRQMDFTGRPMKGFLFIDPEGTDSESDLARWIDRCLKYNPKAKSSKKK